MTQGIQKLNSFGKLKNQPLEIVLCFLLVSIVTTTFAQVLFRYVFQISLAWTEELARYFFMWMASLSIAYAFKTKSHFALTFMIDRLQQKHKKIVFTITKGLMTIFLLVFIWKSFEYTMSVAEQFGPGTGLSMAIPYSSAFVGGVLMLYYIVRDWKNNDLFQQG